MDQVSIEHVSIITLTIVLDVPHAELTSQSNNSRTSEESPHMLQDFDVGRNHTRTSNNLSLILVLSITPAGIVLLVISILRIIILTRMWSECHMMLRCTYYSSYCCIRLQSKVQVRLLCYCILSW